MEEKLPQDRIKIVLVDPRDGANIGSVCRAMKTMGLKNLCLVTERTYDEARVRCLAVHAFDLWENRKTFKTLPEALKGSSLSIAATRRKGKFRKLSSLSPEQLAKEIGKTNEACIVFGRETDGLTDEEVNLCSQTVCIPTSPDFPSLNLAQAVQIICYCLYRDLWPYSFGKKIVTEERILTSVKAIEAEMETTGYFKNEEEKFHDRIFLRDMIARSAPTEAELKKIEKIFVKLCKIKVHKG